MTIGTVLYVEDNDLIARSVLRISDLDFTIERVSTAAEAETWLSDAQDGPLAILIDRRLPDADGLQLAIQLRRQGYRCGVVSGGEPPDGGDVPWMMKPFGRHQLQAFVRSL